MEKLPESLYVDDRGGSSSNSVLQNTARTPQSYTAADRAEIQRLIDLLNHPQTRAEAITQLNRVYKSNKERGRELGLLLWNSRDTTFSLLQEVMGAYRSLSPPKLGMEEATKVCNALALIQLMAIHPDIKMELIKAQIPVYLYAFLNTTESQLVQYDYLRLNSLGVIGALLKEECPKTGEIVHYLLQSEMVPLCLRCMDMGSDLTKSVAAFVLGKILGQLEGKTYCGSYAERFFSVSKALSKMVDEFSGKPPAALLRNILICYLRLAETPRCCEVLKTRYPRRLRNPAYLNHICDGSMRALAEQVVHNIMAGPQVEPVPVETMYQALRSRANVEQSVSC